MKINDIVSIHPASDYFMRGIKCAVVKKIGRKWIYLYDNFTNTNFRVTRFSILESGLWKLENK